MNRIVIDTDQGGPTISKHIYGHFAEHLGRCIYEGIWVGENSPIPNTRGIRNDVVNALKKLKMPNLRWPGGCFADTYHWRDGIGPKKDRPQIVNIHWGGVTEDNHFGTHEFLDLCEMIGTEPYICGNVGSGTVREMSEWLEYLTMPGSSPMANLRKENGRIDPWDIKYWAVGNENWGCGGNMTAQQYAWEFRKFQSYCRHMGGKKLYKIACGQTDQWNDTVMKEAAQFMDGLSVHYYCFTDSWEKKGHATGFPVSEWFGLLKSALGIEKFIKQTSTIMDRYDPDKRVGMIMDEWGAWHLVEPGTNPGFLYQQNTIRDALVAGLSLNIFNRHADRIHMANIAQTINVLQAMILTEGPKMVLTPTYHVFEMLAGHQGATSLPVRGSYDSYTVNTVSLPAISASASRSPSGSLLVSLCNLQHADKAKLEIEPRGKKARLEQARILTAPAMDSRNDFDNPDTVAPADFNEVKAERSGKLKMTLPPRSVVTLELS